MDTILFYPDPERDDDMNGDTLEEIDPLGDIYDTKDLQTLSLKRKGPENEGIKASSRPKRSSCRLNVDMYESKNLENEGMKHDSCRPKRSNRKYTNYLCSLCHEGFTLKFQLIEHLKLHHLTRCAAPSFKSSPNILKMSQKQQQSCDSSVMENVCAKLEAENEEHRYECSVSENVNVKIETEDDGIIKQEMTFEDDSNFGHSPRERKDDFENSPYFLEEEVKRQEPSTSSSNDKIPSNPFKIRVKKENPVEEVFIEEGQPAKHKELKLQKPHVCDLCNEWFTCKSELKAHFLAHGGKKSHICNICNQSFSRYSSLSLHRVTDHSA